MLSLSQVVEQTVVGDLRRREAHMSYIVHTLQWRHYGRGGVSNHQPYDCLLNCLFKAPCYWLLCGEFTDDRWFPGQNASNAEYVSIRWRHHVSVCLPTERQLQRCIQDLFIAGTETISTSLKWAFLFMVCYPEVQKKVQEELDLVVGSGRQPTMKDRDELPYTYATLMECQRAGNIALFSVPRVASQDTTINGHLVPKGKCHLKGL